MKFNMGCGHNKIQGFVNVDSSAICNPDVILDLEKTPWPWESNSADEVIFHHSLEHLGADSGVFLSIIAELYRVCKNNSIVTINVPHPRHDDFISDPTHVRIITPQLLKLFDKSFIDKCREGGYSNSPFAHYLNVDFEITEAHTMLEEPYLSDYHNGKLSHGALVTALKERNNIANEFRIKLKVKK